MRKDSKEKSLFKNILLLAVGAFFGFVGTLSIQHLQNNEIKKTLHRKLFEETKYNLKIGTVMELTGNFKKFEINAWDNFVGTAAFYDLPVDVRRSLDSYYLILKWFNEGMFKWEKLENKAKDELKIKDLKSLAEPYVKFLFDKKIINSL